MQKFPDLDTQQQQVKVAELTKLLCDFIRAGAVAFEIAGGFDAEFPFKSQDQIDTANNRHRSP